MKKFLKVFLPALALLVIPVVAGATFSWSTPSALSSLISMLCKAFQYVGMALLLFGAIQIAFAFKSDDADGKTKGMRSAIAGALVWIIGGAGESIVVA